MSRKLHVALPLLSLAVALGGCSGSLIESKKIDYKSASKAPEVKLEVPPDLTTPSRDGRYVVPDASPKGTATFSAYASERAAPRANSGDVLPEQDKIRVERAGSQRWLVVAQPPEKLWPAIKDFWQENGFLVDRELSDAGVMETDWAENRAKIPMDGLRSLLGKVIDQVYSTSERDKFRTRLERGAQPGTTEIYISHRGMVELYINEGKDQTKWQPRPPDPDLEAEFLRRLAVRLGTDETRAASMMAAGGQQEARAKLERSADGRNTLLVSEAFDRAWRRVGLALDRVGFTVEDRDRAKGLYFVRYVDPEADNKKETGILSKLAFWRGNDKPALDKAQYRIYVAAKGEASAVQVLSAEGGADNSDSAKRILGLLVDQLK